MDANKFGCFVADRRKELNMTQKELAAKIHVTDKAVSRWERGLGFPDINTIKELADALNVSITELMTSEKADSEKTDAVVSDVIHVAKEDINERQKTILYSFAATTAFLSVLHVLLNIDWNSKGIGMNFEFPMIAVIPGIALILNGIIGFIRGRKIKDIIPIGLILVILPAVVSCTAYLICGIVNS
jgi:transcriptional regulator with XRE-family HTH domain